MADSTPLRELATALRDDCRILSEGLRYLDGAEGRVLEIIKSSADLGPFSDELEFAATTWAERYHLSKSRGQLLQPFELSANHRVLEVGAGCGALTRLLATRCELVDALEPVFERARVARARTSDLDNTEVFVGEVRDIPVAPTYDVIVLVGVLEYVGSGSPNHELYVDFLAQLSALLSSGGHILCAIENRLGVKYLTGAPEDHTQRPFDGLDGYPHGTPARTFSRSELIGLFAGAGLNVRLLSAFPDYKMPRVLMADDLLSDPAIQALAWRIPRLPSPDWERARPAIASEASLWRALVGDGLGGAFANSFVVTACADHAPTIWDNSKLAVYNTANRRRKFAVETTVRRGPAGAIRFERCRTEGPPSRVAEGSLILTASTEDYVHGQTMAERLIEDRLDQSLLQTWRELVDKSARSDGTPIDLLPSNLVVTPGGLIAIDREWSHTEYAPIDVLGRGALWLAGELARHTTPSRWSGSTIADIAEDILKATGAQASDGWLQRVIQREAELQAQVLSCPPQTPDWDNSVGTWVRNIKAELETPLKNMQFGDRIWDVVEEFRSKANETDRVRQQLETLQSQLDDQGLAWFVVRLLRRGRALLAPDASRRHRLFLTLKRAARSRRRDKMPARPDRSSQLSRLLSDPGFKLDLTPSAPPVVSVLVVTYNNATRTYECIRSLIDNVDVPFELVLVDNASTDETPELLDRIHGATIVRNGDNAHYLRGCNQAAALARGKYLLLLNNDVVLPPGALRTLTETFRIHPRAGAVGAKLVWPDGHLQEAGSIVWRDGSATGYGRGDEPSKGEYNYLREVDYCSAACLLVRQDLWDALGGFDARYGPAYYEDADLCMGIRSLGFDVLFQPQAEVVHFENTSSSPEWLAARCRQNQPVFESKWRSSLAAQSLPGSGHAVLRARDRRDGRAILVLDDRIPNADLGSGFPRMLAMLRILARAGHRLTFVPLTDAEPYEPASSELQEMGIEIVAPQSLSRFLESRRGLYDVVVVSRPHNAARTFPALWRHMPDAKIVYDAEALYFPREILRARLDGSSADDSRIAKIRRAESAAINAADQVLVVSSTERDAVIGASGRDTGLHIWGHPSLPRVGSPTFSERRDLLFVGGFLSSPSPNEDAVIHFVRHVWPRIQDELPGIRLRIVGRTPPRGVRALESDRVEIVGGVDSLGPVYDACRVFVNPMRYAAGIQLKLIEAMAHGIPAAATEVAAQGFGPNVGDALLVASTDAEFARNVVKLYTDDQLWRRVQEGALAYVGEHFHPDHMERSLLQVLDEPVEEQAVRAQRRNERDIKEGQALWFHAPARRLPLRAWTYFRESGIRGVTRKTLVFMKTALRK